jgi:guanylate kinase
MGRRLDELPERDNPEYRFITKKMFSIEENTGGFISIERFNGYNYGIRKSDMEATLSSAKPGVMMPGYCALDLKRKYADVCIVFVSVPGVDHQNCLFSPVAEACLRKRMTKRGDPIDKIEARISQARRIIEIDRLPLISDFIVVKNDEGGGDALNRIERLLNLS